MNVRLSGAIRIGALSAYVTITSTATAQLAPWPTEGWSVATPAAQDLAPAPLDELHASFAARTFGYVDRLVVVRNGFLVVNQRYENDYREVSHGFVGPLGYQWWRLDRDNVVVWAGRGFGGQFLVVLPQYDLIGVVNSWNIFGGQFPSTLGALIRTLIAAAVPQ